MTANVQPLTQPQSTKGRITLTIEEAYDIVGIAGELPAVSDAKVNYALGYVLSQCRQKTKEADRARDRLQREMSVLTPVNGPDGRPQMGPDQQPVMRPEIPKERHMEFTDKVWDMVREEFTIERAPIKYADVLGTKPETAPKFTPSQLSKLVNIIVDD